MTRLVTITITINIKFITNYKLFIFIIIKLPIGLKDTNFD